MMIATSDGLLLADCRSHRVISYLSSQGPFAFGCLDGEAGRWVVWAEALKPLCLVLGPLSMAQLARESSNRGSNCRSSRLLWSAGSREGGDEDLCGFYQDGQEGGLYDGAEDQDEGGRYWEESGQSSGPTSFFPR